MRKLLKRIITHKLSQFIEINYLLLKTQIRARKDRLVETALQLLIE